jgi:hypothetical protein
VTAVHESVKEGETITAPLEASGVFPPMVISMVDVGEQTGALPEMMMKIADNFDDEVDNAVAAMTSLLEPIMIIFLAVIVGSIVIAMFLPLIDLMNGLGGDEGGGAIKPAAYPAPFTRRRTLRPAAFVLAECGSEWPEPAFDVGLRWFPRPDFEVALPPSIPLRAEVSGTPYFTP